MKNVILKSSSKDGNIIEFRLLDCPYEGGKYALEFFGVALNGREWQLGIPRLTKDEIKEISDELAAAVKKLK